MQCEGQPFHMQTTTNHSLNRCSIIWDQEFWLKHLAFKILCFKCMVGAPETFTTYMLYGIGTIGPYLRRQGDPWPISSRSSSCTFHNVRMVQRKVYAGHRPAHFNVSTTTTLCRFCCFMRIKQHVTQNTRPDTCTTICCDEQEAFLWV